MGGSNACGGIDKKRQPRLPLLALRFPPDIRYWDCIIRCSSCTCIAAFLHLEQYQCQDPSGALKAYVIDRGIDCEMTYLTRIRRIRPSRRRNPASASSWPCGPQQAPPRPPGAAGRRLARGRRAPSPRGRPPAAPAGPANPRAF